MAYRSRKQTYAKKYIDNLFYKLNIRCVVSLTKLVAEDIENYKLSLIKNKENTAKEEVYISEDDVNISEDDKTSKSDNESKNDQKSKDIKTSKDITTSKDDKAFKDDKASKDITTSKDDKAFKDDKASTDDKAYKDDKASNDDKADKASKDDTADKASKDDTADKASKDDTADKASKDDTVSKENTDEPARKKPKLDTDGRDVLKLVLSREGETYKFKSQFKSSLKLNDQIASTSTEEEPIVIDCEESAESVNSSAKNEKQWISVIDVKKMMNEDNYIRWMKMINSDKSPNDQTNGVKKLAVAKLPISEPKVNEVKLPLNGKKYAKEHLLKIENLYKKYFTKSIQDTIVIIANILNIISMSNKHHKSRMDESFKKKSEAEKLKERCDANRVHGRHKKILETMLKSNFTNVVKSFVGPDFDSLFQMFFLSILTVLRVLDEPKFKKGSIFKNLVLLLWNSLKNSDYKDSKVFSIFRSKTFRPECIDLISLIEDSRDIDPGVNERMSLFFVSTVDSRECFQAVINAVTSNLNENLKLLMDRATSQCRVNSKFKDSLTVQHSNAKIPVTATIQSPIKSDGIIKHWFLAKNPDGTYQQIPLLNAHKSQTIGNTAGEPSIVTSQPLNNFYQPITSSLQKTIYEPSTSKVIPANKCFVVAPTNSHGSLVQVKGSLSGTATSIPTTFVTLKPTIQNKKSVSNSPLLTAEGGTILLGNKQYQLVKRPLSSGQVRTIVNGTNISVKSPQTSVTRCFAKNCNNPAKIMCSTCTSVKYCNHKCQRFDWYDSHINDCERMLNEKTHP